MNLKIYYNDEELILKYKNKIIVESNYLFTKKRFIYEGRIVDYDVFLDYFETIISKNKIKANSVDIAIGLNNKNIDILLLKELFTKMGYKKTNIKYIKDLLCKREYNNITIVLECNKYLEVYEFKNYILNKKYTIPNMYFKYIKYCSMYIVGKNKPKKNNQYYLENAKTFIINKL